MPQLARTLAAVVDVRGRSQLSTFMKAYTAYARGEGVWDHRTLFPRKSTFIFNHWQCIIKYCTCLECGQYAHICRSVMYSNTFEALFLSSKCTNEFSPEIFGTHGTMKNPIPSSWSVDFSGPRASHVAEATCIFTLFNVERWSAAWSLIINKCLFS